MELSSRAITANQPIPLKYAEPGAAGSNVAPDLSWSDVPAGTQSFAITVFDPDAPTGSGWWHWVAIDIPATVTALAEGEPLPATSRQWVNDYGYIGYGGPNPPAGPAHHYIFTVYALPFARLPLADTATSAMVRARVIRSALDAASITATFGQTA